MFYMYIGALQNDNDDDDDDDERLQTNAIRQPAVWPDYQPSTCTGRSRKVVDQMMTRNKSTLVFSANFFPKNFRLIREYVYGSRLLQLHY